MSATSLMYREDARPRAVLPIEPPGCLSDLAKLASVEIETSLVTDLSENLHTLFDPVSDGVLPIYFGPLLGRLYLEGL